MNLQSLSRKPMQGERIFYRVFKYMLHEIFDQGHRIHQLSSATNLAGFDLIQKNRLHCLAGRIYALRSRISYKIYLKFLWGMLFHSVKVLLKGFTMSAKVLSVYCKEFSFKAQMLNGQIYKKLHYSKHLSNFYLKYLIHSITILRFRLRGRTWTLFLISWYDKSHSAFYWKYSIIFWTTYSFFWIPVEALSQSRACICYIGQSQH